MNFKSGDRSREWVKRLPQVVSPLNNEETRLTGKRPVDAIKEKLLEAKPSSTYSRPVGLREKKLDYSVNLRYLLAAGELEGGQKTAPDPIWSLKVFNIEKSVMKEGEPVLYYLKDVHKRGFVREELMIIPKETESASRKTFLILNRFGNKEISSLVWDNKED